MSTFRPRSFFWIALAYLSVIALILYPGLHEGFGLRIIIWNCIPPTFGLVLIMTAFGKARPRMVISTVFATIAAATAIFFFAAWFFTSLDTDPHSLTTKLVFIGAPVFSIVLGGLGIFVTWLATKGARSAAS